MSLAEMGDLEATMWRRHANPKSGWTRVPTGAVIVYGVYTRDLRLLVAALVWAAVNPFLFPPPADDDAWMTRAVRAERWWIYEEGNATVGLDYPNLVNAVGALGFLSALYVAWRRRPTGAALGAVASVCLKLWWLRVLVERYDAAGGAGGAGQGSD